MPDAGNAPMNVRANGRPGPNSVYLFIVGGDPTIPNAYINTEKETQRVGSEAI